MPQHLKAIAKKFATQGWGTQQNWEKTWKELMCKDVIYHFNSFNKPIIGLAENIKFNKALFTGFPDLKQNIEDILSEDDKVVYRSTLIGTNTGAFLDQPATQRCVKINDFTLLKITDNKIVEWWYECNLLKVMEQIGHIK